LNGQIVKLFSFILALFVLLLGFTSYWSVFDAPGLEANQANRRALLLEQRIHRGDIRSVDGEVIARSLPSGQGKSRIWTREYPYGGLFGNPIGYSFTERGRVGTELAHNDELIGNKSEFLSVLDELSGHKQEGATVVSSLDASVQQVAFDGLAGQAGAVVAIVPKTGEVRAMVGGSDFEERPFNLATQGYRQPGSTFKTFVLATALAQGRSPSEVFSSQPKQFPIPGISPKKEMFVVNNYDDNYLGSASIATATQYSDNSVYAELGLQVGTKKIARMAQDMGIETPVSTNPAMTLGGLDNYCCTPLEMTHAYQTLAAGGNRISGTLDSLEGDVGKDPRDDGPVPIVKITDSKGDLVAENKVTKSRVLSTSNANTAKGILQSVISGGTGTHAATGGYAWGKTGTTENYGDAWFCGGSEHFTSCVWVGYPDSVKSMETEYGGSPVAGGTYPAEIWSRIIQALEAIQAGYGSGKSSGASSGSSSSYSPSYSAPAAPAGGAGGGGGGGQPQAPAPAPTPSSGGGGGVGL